MQTFLPYISFYKTAKCLDRQRLGKQRVEDKQSLDALATRNGWSNHPNVTRWRGYEETLKLHFNIVSQEWERRGYLHTMGYYEIDTSRIIRPPWLVPDLCDYYQILLIYKDPKYYNRIFPDTNLGEFPGV